MKLLILIRSLVVPFVFFVLLNTVTVSLTKNKFGICLPFTMILSVIVLYFSQLLLGTFVIGMLLLLAVAVFGLIVLIVRKKEIYPLVATNGFIAFVAIYCIFAVLDFHRNFYDFDEFWHWGMMVKEMLRLDKFYCVKESTLLIHKDYPPFLAIFEMLWCRLSGAYAEGGVTMSLHVFSFSMLVLPLSEKIFTEQKKVRRSFADAMLVGAVIFLLVASFDVANTINTILVDIPVAIVFAYAMLLVMTEACYGTKFGFARFIAALAALLMVKQVGLAMFFVVLFAYVIFLFYTKTEKRLVPAVGSFIAAVLIPGGIYYTWASYVKRLNVSDIRSVDGGSGQFDLGQIDFRQYLYAVTGKTQDLASETFLHLMQAFLKENVADGFPVTYYSAFLWICLALFLMARFFPIKFPKRKAFLLGTVLFVGTAGFAFMLSVLFLFCFLPDEMQELRGYGRYVDSYLIGEVLLLFILCLQYIYDGKESSFKKRDRIFLTSAVMLICINPTNLIHVIPQCIRGNKYQMYENVSNVINKAVPEKGTVGILYFDDLYGVDWYAQCFLQYYSNGRIITPMNYTGKDLEDSAVAGQLLQEAGKFEYIYTGNLSGQAAAILQELGDGELPKADQVYAVKGKLIPKE